VTGVQIVQQVGVALKLNTNLIGNIYVEILKEITAALQRGEEVKLIGYGTLRLKTLKKRTYKFQSKKEKAETNTVRLYTGRKSKWRNMPLSKKSQNQSPERKLQLD